MLVFIIEQIRKKKNISLYQLSKMTGISRTYLRDLENNRKTNPSTNILEKVSEALETNIKNLFYSKLDIKDLKQEMYKRIDIYGINSKEALEISQIIDLLVNIDMKDKL